MNFKKCTSLFLALLLLVSNIGLAFNVHYCGDEIASVSSVYNVEEVCEMPEIPADKACCAAEMAINHKKCCSDKVVDLQDKGDDILVKNFSFQIDVPFVATAWEPLVFPTVPSVKALEQTAYYCDANAPPLFKLYSQYLLYA